jgi:D-alanyl-lipoteichoic acid acyltransferase DltB (MBOAT superfamily)
VLNVGILCVFKYYDFFIENFVAAFASVGVELQPTSLRIILPVGISFYTFQALSYTIDVYRKRIRPTQDLVAFMAFVAFFPQLVAGPIERASKLLPQFYVERKFDYASAIDGLRQMLWGFFKKIVIADNCALLVNEIFNRPDVYRGSMLVLGAVFFSFQIYGDFSGYSDIALGTARLFGFNLTRNFAFPYFSRNIAEFWRRWHISLTGWFRDYVYIPLGGSRGSKGKTIRNTLVIFLVSGFWHGAKWTFVAWGACHALLYLLLILSGKNRRYTDVVAAGKLAPTVREFFCMAGTFALVAFGWILFRAENLGHAAEYVSGIFSGSLFSLPRGVNVSKTAMLTVSLLITAFVLTEWRGRECEYAIEKLLTDRNRYLRYSFYAVLAFAVVCCMFNGKSIEFIYFQF